MILGLYKTRVYIIMHEAMKEFGFKFQFAEAGGLPTVPSHLGLHSELQANLG